MATIGVLSFNMTSENNNIRLANQQQTVDTIANNNVSEKIGAKLTGKRNIVMIRKRQKLQPLSESNTNIMNVSEPVMSPAAIKIEKPAKIAKIREQPAIVSVPSVQRPVSIKGTKSSPLPMAVARRNARERNRVKQVNNGFAALRERIPEEVAEAFEAQGNGRGSSKKLSKVETLRMAVEYIRSLERVLANDTDDQYSEQSEMNPSDASVLSSMTTPPPEPNNPVTYEDEAFMTTSQQLPELIAVINGHQYMRVAGTNTYQLFSSVYQNEENIQPIQQILLPSDYESEQNLINTTIGYTPQTPIHVMTPASVSPSNFSGQSMSPTISDIKQEHYYVQLPHSPSDDSTSADGLYLPTSQHFEGVLTLKTEVSDDHLLLSNHHQNLSAETMIDGIEWWDSTPQQQHPQSSAKIS